MTTATENTKTDKASADPSSKNPEFMTFKMPRTNFVEIAQLATYFGDSMHEAAIKARKEVIASRDKVSPEEWKEKKKENFLYLSVRDRMQSLKDAVLRTCVAIGKMDIVAYQQLPDREPEQYRLLIAHEDDRFITVVGKEYFERYAGENGEFIEPDKKIDEPKVVFDHPRYFTMLDYANMWTAHYKNIVKSSKKAETNKSE